VADLSTAVGDQVLIIEEVLMPIDWAVVNWVNVGLLSAFAFLAALIGGILSFNSRLIGAILAALLFAALYIFWNYYPHGVVLPNVKSG
jgi:hypothetical protein